MLIPTGTGQPRLLPRGGIDTHAATFFPDGRGYVYGYRRVLSELYAVTGLR